MVKTWRDSRSCLRAIAGPADWPVLPSGQGSLLLVVFAAKERFDHDGDASLLLENSAGVKAAVT
jgi:hypothetical protein